MKKLMLIMIVTLLLATPVFAKNDPKYINNKSIFIVNKNVKIPITEKFSSYNIMITNKNKVYVWGWNEQRQLGLGDTIHRSTPIKNTNLENIIRRNGGVRNIQRLYFSYYRSVLIFKNNKVYIWPIGNYGTIKENTNLEDIIRQNGGVENIQGLYVGGYHNILIFKNGKVYVWGWNDVGQLGLGDKNDRYTPTENKKLENVISQNSGAENIQGLYVGGSHNILIFKNGKVYVWGETSGTSPMENYNLENIINQNGGLENIYGLYVGCCHNILIFKNGKVYVWGRNWEGELGLGYEKYIPTPTENTNLEGVISSAGFPLSVGGGIISKISVLL